LQNKRRIKLFELLNNKGKKIESQNKLIILFRPENVFYLTNFWGEGITIISEKSQTKLLVPLLEYTRALNTSKECDVIQSERGIAIINTLANLIQDKDIVYSDVNDFDTIRKIQQKIGNNNLVIDSSLLYKLREIKESEEINNIKNASKIIDTLFEIAVREIKEGVTEEQIQSILVYEALKLGARFPSYPYTTNPLIIASGPQGSFPHAETSNKKMKAGELIVIDITLSFNHYISDSTRTFGLGSITREMQDVYETVKTAQENGIKHIRNTSDFSEIDACCRGVITGRKRGEHFTHSTGHGIGLEIHEPPWIRPNCNSKIKENMTITVEPGIYIENKFGVRIEDSILITGKRNNEAGHNFTNFHAFSKDLIIL
jgi:Xaa-Pro aminopeptidase